VKFIGCCCVLGVVHNCLQNINAKSSRHQFLVKSQVVDSFESGHNWPKFVGVRDNLDNDSDGTEEKTCLYLESFEFIADVVDHVIQLVKVLTVETDDVSQQISFLFLGLNRGFTFGDLDGVVSGQHQGRSISYKRSDVPLWGLTFQNAWKAGKKVLEKFENLNDVRLVELKSAVECDPIVVGKFEIKMIKFGNASVHPVDHLWLKVKRAE
jgi:hypothetical protein